MPFVQESDHHDEKHRCLYYTVGEAAVGAFSSQMKTSSVSRPETVIWLDFQSTFLARASLPGRTSKARSLRKDQRGGMDGDDRRLSVP